MNRQARSPGASPLAARSSVARWLGSVFVWIRGIGRSPRRATLAGSMLVLLVVSAAVPLGGQDVSGSAQFSIAFFATLLTGEAVIFALSFSASSAWPSLREIDSYIAFREWVIAGWLAAMLTASGLLTHAAIPATYGALLFLLADAFGMFSFVRLFGLASADGRKRLLRRTLADALVTVTVTITAPAAGLRERMSNDRVLNAYLGQLDEAAARSDGNGVRDLADELASGPPAANETAAFALHLDVVHRLARAALVGKLDPVVATGAADTLISALLSRIAADQRADRPVADQAGSDRAAAAMAQASRYLAWLAGTSLTLSVRDVTTAGAARELVALGVRVRDQILLLADPDPRYASDAADLGTPLRGTAAVLAWIGAFSEFHGSAQAAGMYPVYEILTGTKFLGNYWEGDSVLSRLRDTLFGPGSVDEPAAQATRGAFETVGEFDRIWTLISVGAIATLRDVRVPHPPGLIRPEFTPDPRLLGAYVRTFASHRYFATASQALVALTRLVGYTGQPDDLWHQAYAISASIGWCVPMPMVEPHRRPAACVLAIASRLAPLATGESDRELRTFLTGLPGPVLDATARLSARILPSSPSSGHQASGPADMICDRLGVLQLVTRRAGLP